MNTLAALMLHSLCDQEGLSFLECSCSEHKFVTAEEYTGGTKYVCRKCGLIYHKIFLPNNYEFDRLYAGSTLNGQIIQGTKQINTDVIDLDPDCTIQLFSADEGIRLFRESCGKDIWISVFNKNIKTPKANLCVGRDAGCDLQLMNSRISRFHADFAFDGTSWLVQDLKSTNGTWLNDTKLLPGKQYILHMDDVLDFAHVEKIVFYKSSKNDVVNIAHSGTPYIHSEATMLFRRFCNWWYHFISTK